MLYLIVKSRTADNQVTNHSHQLVETINVNSNHVRRRAHKTGPDCSAFAAIGSSSILRLVNFVGYPVVRPCLECRFIGFADNEKLKRNSTGGQYTWSGANQLTNRLQACANQVHVDSPLRKLGSRSKLESPGSCQAVGQKSICELAAARFDDRGAGI